VHHATQVPSYRSDDAATGDGYGNRFSAVSSDIVFKPLATTRKPRILGPQTAHVVGASGDEIHLDKYGRVKVQFFWDRAGTYGDVNDSTWVRVAQPWASNKFGAYFWPRVNDEVVVQFLNGDPDNPVITGSVYNGTNMPPYTLPDNSTRSGVLTRSSKGGSASTSNELRFEDKMGSEQIYMHAEKDMDFTVENDQRRSVGHNDSLTVTGDQMEKIGGNSSLTIGGNLTEKIGGNADLAIGGNQTENVGSNFALNVGQNHSEKVGMNYSLDAGMQAYIKAGMALVIEAGLELTLKASGGFITIGPSGVSISGIMVLINSGGAAGSGSAGDVPSPSSPTAPDTPDDGTKGTKMN
jgi:type VI secretion system secreted protein VgrG